MKQEIKYREYKGIDYIALLVYIMKNNVSLEKAIQNNNLPPIARSTFTRNINKLLEDKNTNTDIIEIIKFYKNQYVPHKQCLPKDLKQEIMKFPDKKIMVKNELDFLYEKLSTMKQIIDACGGNMTKAATLISSGDTVLGKITITHQALSKNMKRYEIIQAQIKKRNQQEDEKLEERE